MPAPLSKFLLCYDLHVENQPVFGAHAFVSMEAATEAGIRGILDAVLADFRKLNPSLAQKVAPRVVIRSLTPLVG